MAPKGKINSFAHWFAKRIGYLDVMMKLALQNSYAVASEETDRLSTSAQMDFVNSVIKNVYMINGTVDIGDHLKIMESLMQTKLSPEQKGTVAGCINSRIQQVEGLTGSAVDDATGLPATPGTTGSAGLAGPTGLPATPGPTGSASPSGSAASIDRDKGQQCDFFHNYLLASQWEVLMNAGVTADQKSALLLQACHKLDLLHPTEECVGKIVSLTGCNNYSLVGDPGLVLVRKFKAALKAILPPHDSSSAKMLRLQIYPEFPKDLPQHMYAVAYSVGPPGLCPLTPVDVSQLRTAIALRTTKGTVSQQLDRQCKGFNKALARGEMAGGLHHTQLDCLAPAVHTNLPPQVRYQEAAVPWQPPSADADKEARLGQYILHEARKGQAGLANLHRLVDDLAMRDIHISMSPPKERTAIEDLNDAYGTSLTRSASPTDSIPSESPAQATGSAGPTAALPGSTSSISETIKHLAKRKLDDGEDGSDDDDDEDSDGSNTTKKKARRKAKAKGKAKAKAMSKRPASCSAAKPVKKNKSSDSKDYPVWTVEPPSGATFPLIHRGCKVYHAVTDRSWRVMPRPGLSLYDKRFGYTTTTKQKVWAAVLVYCKNPSIPSSSTNYVK